MKSFFKFFFFLFPFLIHAQNVTIEGYVYEENNRGYLNLAEITILDKSSKAIKANAITNKEGFFTIDLPTGTHYIVRAEKDLFERKEITLDATNPKAKLYAKLEMTRKPGYIFDVTIAEKRLDPTSVVDAIAGSRIEVYNNTTDEEALVLENHQSPAFKFTFEQGNHYTIMIRKEGFFTKRMEAYVNVKGCILCFDGIGNVQPGVTDNLTEGHQMGTLLANVEMIPIKVNESIALENIYYDLGKWDIRPDATKELDKLVIVLKDNPAVVVELGSHTDSRGGDDFNMDLSQKRAAAAVDYIIEKGVDTDRISARGYGEIELMNKCSNGVKCSEAEHQKNRRTTLKIVGLKKENPMANLSLAEIIEAEKFDKMLLEIQNQEVVKIEEGEEMPDFIKNEEPEKKIPSKYRKPKSSVEAEAKAKFSDVVETKKEKVITAPIKKEAPVAVDRAKEQRGSLGSADFLKSEAVKTPTANSMIVEEVEIRNDLNYLAPKSIPGSYSGYKVEIMTLDSELPLDHAIFQRHGNLCVEKLSGGKVAYLLGEFKAPDHAESFVEKILKSRYPTAKVVGYQAGRRI